MDLFHVCALCTLAVWKAERKLDKLGLIYAQPVHLELFFPLWKCWQKAEPNFAGQEIFLQLHIKPFGVV